MRRATQACMGIVCVIALGLSVSDLGAQPAKNPVQSFAEIQALIGILSDKIEAVQESVDNLSHGGEGHPTLRWDQVLPAGDRFEVLAAFNGEAVLDKETGLVWEKSPRTTMHTWELARFQCNNRTTGGRKGWRLPSVHELASLVDPANTSPVLPSGHPFTDVQSAHYWSATTAAENPSFAWHVFFGNGLVNGGGKGNSFTHAWCVRGGMNADQY